MLEIEAETGDRGSIPARAPLESPEIRSNPLDKKHRGRRSGSCR